MNSCSNELKINTKLNQSEWLLTLLYADNNAPIKGRTMFVKELFVMSKEDAPNIEEVFNFEPNKYGPYSSSFQNILTNLVKNGLVIEEHLSEEENEGNERYDYSLTKTGEMHAQTVRKKFSDKEWAILDSKKRMMERMGLWGLLHYVYTSYPDYTVRSELLL
jgi:uncharacterized protein YwgA